MTYRLDRNPDREIQDANLARFGYCDGGMAWNDAKEADKRMGLNQDPEYLREWAAPRFKPMQTPIQG